MRNMELNGLYLQQISHQEILVLANMTANYQFYQTNWNKIWSLVFILNGHIFFNYAQYMQCSKNKTMKSNER